MSVRMHAASVAEINPVTLYRMLQLRTDVFVVEQQCPYPELDGRDLESHSIMVWAEADTEAEAAATATATATATVEAKSEATAAAKADGSTGESSPDAAVIATLRILRDEVSGGDASHGDGGGRAEAVLRIGRVTAHPNHRGSGLARAIFQYGLEQCAALAPDLAIVLDAQEPLERWYGSFGFERVGPTFVEDGIPHVPMRRPA